MGVEAGWDGRRRTQPTEIFICLGTLLSKHISLDNEWIKFYFPECSHTGIFIDLASLGWSHKYAHSVVYSPSNIGIYFSDKYVNTHIIVFPQCYHSPVQAGKGCCITSASALSFLSYLVVFVRKQWEEWENVSNFSYCLIGQIETSVSMINTWRLIADEWIQSMPLADTLIHVYSPYVRRWDHSPQCQAQAANHGRDISTREIFPSCWALLRQVHKEPITNSPITKFVFHFAAQKMCPVKEKKREEKAFLVSLVDQEWDQASFLVY